MGTTQGEAGKLLTVREAAAALDVSRMTIYEAIRSGQMLHISLPGRRANFRIPASEIDRILTPRQGVAESKEDE